MIPEVSYNSFPKETPIENKSVRDAAYNSFYIRIPRPNQREDAWGPFLMYTILISVVKDQTGAFPGGLKVLAVQIPFLLILPFGNIGSPWFRSTNPII